MLCAASSSSGSGSMQLQSPPPMSSTASRRHAANARACPPARPTLRRYGTSTSNGTGQGVTIYVVDSGIRLNHQEFKNDLGTRCGGGWAGQFWAGVGVGGDLGRGGCSVLRCMCAAHVRATQHTAWGISSFWTQRAHCPWAAPCTDRHDCASAAQMPLPQPRRRLLSPPLLSPPI